MATEFWKSCAIVSSRDNAQGQRQMAPLDLAELRELTQDTPAKSFR